MRYALYCTVCAALTFLLLALSARYVSDFWLFSFFFSLATHLGLAAILGSAFALLLRRSVFSVLLLVWSLAVTGHSLFMRQEFLADTTTEIPAGAPSFKLMSLNVLFNNWEGADAITDAIIASGADVVYLLEAIPMSERLQRLQEAYPYRVGCGIATDTCDLIILSKHPLSKPTFINLSDLRRHRFVIVDMQLGDRTVHLAAVHLTKPYYDEYHTDELLLAKAILRKLRSDFVIGGDFNSASIAPDMQHFLRALSLKTGEKEPATWPDFAGEWGIPIDHIFATARYRIRNLQAVEPHGSNHLGLSAEVVLLPKP
ncbi:endonuclease/exonuclease/phosphatase family protein [Rhizobium sp. RU36D]|uniref:endonuclease/exonuclease/phosphatase family protein n=1 Tax=Rhizobium sp. RU36D TaxID=1907415 RepID=UPI0015C42B4F|nr:endonuclease/exonuclease/phosphatase family protein [Rhizobium sp. RU36D]